MKYLLALAIACFLEGCDPGYNFTEEIINNSSETVQFYLTYGMGSTAIVDSSIVLLPDSKMEVTNHSGLGVASGYTCGERFSGASILVKTTNNKMLYKDVTDSNNWTSTYDKSFGGSEKHCVLEINDSDLKY